MIESEGYVARFEGTKYRYLQVDSFLYWTSRSLWTPGQNITDASRPTLQDSPITSRAGFPCDLKPKC